MWWNELKIKQLELAHLERLKCLERGQPLPDTELAWVATVRERGQQLTAIMIVGTIFLMGGADPPEAFADDGELIGPHGASPAASHLRAPIVRVP